MGDWIANFDNAFMQLETARARMRNLLHIRAGDRVLDVGCGSGMDALYLARLVGVDGWVEGVDIDPYRVQEDERTAQAHNISGWVHYSQCDVDRPLPFPACDFSATCSVRLLEYVRKPRFVLSEMVRVTRPGGWIVCLDTDWGTLSIDLPETSIERKVAHAKAECCYPNGYAARQTYRHFRKLGLVEMLIEPYPVFFTNAASARKILGFDTLEKRAVTDHWVSKHEIDQWREQLEKAEHEGTFFAMVNLLLIAGRRPSSEDPNSRWPAPDPFEPLLPLSGEEI